MNAKMKLWTLKVKMHLKFRELNLHKIDVIVSASSSRRQQELIFKLIREDSLINRLLLPIRTSKRCKIKSCLHDLDPSNLQDYSMQTHLDKRDFHNKILEILVYLNWELELVVERLLLDIMMMIHMKLLLPKIHRTLTRLINSLQLIRVRIGLET
jgi:hypothetical protein